MTPTEPTDALPLEISVEQVHQLRQVSTDPPLVLIDCREPQEYDYCRIEGALLIPMNQTPEQLDTLRANPGSRMVIYCHHGVRSRQVAAYLRQQGIEQAQSMAGGIDQWSLQIDAAVARY